MSSGLMSTCSMSFKKKITCFSSALVSSCGALSIEAAVALFDVARAYDIKSNDVLHCVVSRFPRFAVC